jgi:predicted GNAT family N-acyltransferase
MILQLIHTGTDAYEHMKRLRLEVLLRPIGVPESYINPEREQHELLLGAFEGELLVGCCILTGADNKRIQLRQMAVEKASQGQHVGARIVGFAEQIARERGFTELFMNARDVVIPFYLKCGYEVQGEGFEEVNIPHHMMSKLL